MTASGLTHFFFVYSIIWVVLLAKVGPFPV